MAFKSVLITKIYYFLDLFIVYSELLFESFIFVTFKTDMKIFFLIFSITLKNYKKII